VKLVDEICRPQKIVSINGEDLPEQYKGKLTSCGALMGLGPSWTLLSLLNSYCALSAGIKASSFRVCGDDLVALGTARQLSRYENNLRKIGLIPNIEKSFRGDNAVFCERYCTTEVTKKKRKVVLEDDAYYMQTVYVHTLTSQSLLRISQAAGTRLLSLGERSALKALGQTDELLNAAEGKGAYPVPPRPLARLARDTAKSIAVGQGGLISFGGGGRGKITRTTFNMLVSDGVFNPTTKRRTETLKRLQEEVLSIPPTISGSRVDRKKLLEEVTIGQSSLEQCRQTWLKPKPVNPKSVRRKFNSRYRRASKLNPYRVLRQRLEKDVERKLITQEQLIETFKRVTAYLRVGAYRRAIRTYKTYTSYVPLDSAMALLDKIQVADGIISDKPLELGNILRRQRLGIVN